MGFVKLFVRKVVFNMTEEICNKISSKACSFGLNAGFIGGASFYVYQHDLIPKKKIRSPLH